MAYIVALTGSDHGEGEAWLHASHEKVPDEHGPVRHAHLVTVKPPHLVTDPRVLKTFFILCSSLKSSNSMLCFLFLFWCSYHLEAQTAEHPLHVLQLGGVRPNLVRLPVRDGGEGAAATHPQLR